MEWIKISTSVPRGEEDILIARLSDFGIEGAQINDPTEVSEYLKETSGVWDYVDEDLMKEVDARKDNKDALVTVDFYLPNDPNGTETLGNIRMSLQDCEFVSDVEDDETWLNEWKKYYKPLRIGRRIVVRPVWEDYDSKPEDVVFTIDPGHVFGTGLHQTTQLCLEAIEKYIPENPCILDIGCGSGILSIVSMLLNPSAYVWACDIDPYAEKTTLQNAALNNIKKEHLHTYTGNVLCGGEAFDKLTSRRYDLIVSNIVADVIVELKYFYQRCIQKGGLLITSGIIESRLEDVKTVLTDSGFTLIEVFERDGWYCIVWWFE